MSHLTPHGSRVLKSPSWLPFELPFCIVAARVMHLRSQCGLSVSLISQTLPHLPHSTLMATLVEQRQQVVARQQRLTGGLAVANSAGFIGHAST